MKKILIIFTFLFLLSSVFAIEWRVWDETQESTVETEGQEEQVGTPFFWTQEALQDNDQGGFDSDSDWDWLSDDLEISTYFTDIYNADSDSDWLNDYEEVVIYWSYPNNADSDWDWLSDYKEAKLYYTDVMRPDPDGDWLNDAIEVIRWTDSFDSDSDWDWISDWDEVNVHFTNPNVRDSDWDWISDWDELRVFLTNPNARDSDWDWINDWDEIRHYWTNPATFNELEDFVELNDPVEHPVEDNTLITPGQEPSQLSTWDVQDTSVLGSQDSDIPSLDICQWEGCETGCTWDDCQAVCTWEDCEVECAWNDCEVETCNWEDCEIECTWEDCEIECSWEDCDIDECTWENCDAQCDELDCSIICSWEDCESECVWNDCQVVCSWEDCDTGCNWWKCSINSCQTEECMITCDWGDCELEEWAWANEETNSITIVDENWDSMTIVDESWEPIDLVDEEWNPVSLTDEAWNEITIVDENWEPIDLVDEEWNHAVQSEDWTPAALVNENWTQVGLTDEAWDSTELIVNGSETATLEEWAWANEETNSITIVDENWDSMTIVDESWEPIDLVDEEWNPVSLTDEAWNEITIVDENWEPIDLVDEEWNHAVQSEDWTPAALVNENWTQVGLTDEAWDSTELIVNGSETATLEEWAWALDNEWNNWWWLGWNNQWWENNTWLGWLGWWDNGWCQWLACDEGEGWWWANGGWWLGWNNQWWENNTWLGWLGWWDNQWWCQWLDCEDSLTDDWVCGFNQSCPYDNNDTNDNICSSATWSDLDWDTIDGVIIQNGTGYTVSWADLWPYDFYGWWCTDLDPDADLDWDGIPNFADENIDGDNYDNCYDKWPYNEYNWGGLWYSSWQPDTQGDFDWDTCENFLDICPFEWTMEWEAAYCWPELYEDTDDDYIQDRIDPCPEDQYNQCEPSYKYIATTCPFYVSQYEELLLNSFFYSFSKNYFNSFYVNDDWYETYVLDNLSEKNDQFQSDYLDEYEIEIRQEAYDELVETGLDSYIWVDPNWLWIWPNIHLSDRDARSALAEHNYWGYINKQQIDFLAHSIYYKHKDDTAQFQVINALTDQAQQWGIWELLHWSWFTNVFNMKFAWDDNKIASINHILQKYINKPYIDYLEADRLELIESMLTNCHGTSNADFEFWTMCTNKEEVRQKNRRWYWETVMVPNDFWEMAKKVVLNSFRIFILKTHNIDYEEGFADIDFESGDMIDLFFSDVNDESGENSSISDDLEDILKGILLPDIDDIYWQLSTSEARRICDNDGDCIDDFIKEVFVGHYLASAAENIEFSWMNSDLTIATADTSWIIDKMQKRYEDFVKLDVFYTKFWNAASLHLDDDPASWSAGSSTWVDSSSTWNIPTWFQAELANWLDCNKPLMGNKDIGNMLFDMRTSAENWINSMAPIDYFQWVLWNVQDNLVIDDDFIDRIFTWSNTVDFIVAASPVDIEVDNSGWGGGGWWCPLVYIKWEGWLLEFNWFSSIFKFSKFLKWDSFVKLAPEVVDGKIEVSIAEIQFETFYLDNLSLIYVKHWKWDDINIDNKWNIYSLINHEKIIFDENQDSNFINIDLWTFNSEKIVKIQWWIKDGVSMRATHLINTWLQYVKEYFAWNPLMISIVKYVFNDSFVWREISKNIMLPFYSIEFQYFNWDEWEVFDYIWSSNEERIVKIDSSLLNKKIRIRYNKNINQLTWIWKADTVDNFTSEEIELDSKVWNRIYEKLSEVDDDYQLINHWEKLDVFFDVDNFDKNKSTLFLKTNWYYNTPSL